MRVVFALALALVLVRAGPASAQRRYVVVTAAVMPAPAVSVFAVPYVPYYAPALVYRPLAAQALMLQPAAQDDLSSALGRLQREMTLLSATVSTHTEILNAHDAALRRLQTPPPK